MIEVYFAFTGPVRKQLKIAKTPEMPSLATAAWQRSDGRWHFVSPNRRLGDGLAIWTESEMQAVLTNHFLHENPT